MMGEFPDLPAKFFSEIKEGGAGLYYGENSFVSVKDGIIKVVINDNTEITIKNGAIHLEGEKVTCSGILEAKEIHDKKGSLHDLRDAYKTHKHLCNKPGDPSGPADNAGSV